MKLVYLLFVLPLALAQVPIPNRPPGFVYNNGDEGAPVYLDVYMGPLCPDSGAALPTIQGVADAYGPKTLRLKIHLFPLPYHHNSFLIAEGTHAVDQITKKNMTYYWTQQVYKNLEAYFDVSLTQGQVIMKMAAMAKGMGISQADFLRVVNDQTLNEDCRIEWKYACSRGVVGTPTFMVNDVVVAADPMWSVDDWKKVIDPLLKTRRGLSVGEDCKIGTKRCEYLPGKVECCTSGEACIPNVGCRC